MLNGPQAAVSGWTFQARVGSSPILSIVSTLHNDISASAATLLLLVEAVAVPMTRIGGTEAGILVDPYSPQSQKWARTEKVMDAGSPGRPSLNSGLQP